MRCDELGVRGKQQGDVMRRRLLRLSGVSVEVETFSSDRSQVAPATAREPETRQAHEPQRATGEGGSLVLVYIQTD